LNFGADILIFGTRISKSCFFKVMWGGGWGLGTSWRFWYRCREKNFRIPLAHPIKNLITTFSILTPLKVVTYTKKKSWVLETSERNKERKCWRTGYNLASKNSSNTGELAVGLWVHRDNWLGAQIGASSETKYKRSKIAFAVTSDALSLGLAAQSLTWSPGTLLESVRKWGPRWATSV